MEKLGRTGRGVLVIGLLILMQLANLVLVGRLAPVGIVLVVFYCLFVLWIWVAKGMGNLFLLFDQFARLALRSDEKKEALVVGGGVLLGLALFATGLLIKQIGVVFVGLTLIAAAFPMSLVFTNRSKRGRVIFGVVGGLVYLGGLLSLLLVILPTGDIGGFATTLFGWTMIMALVTTWLGNIPALRR